MFEIENCYRIIFEAMLEEFALCCMAERIGQYTRAGIAFVTGTGKILACSGLWESLFPVSAEKRHLTFKDYEIIYDREEDVGRYWCMIPVHSEKLVTGQIVLVYEDKEEKELFQELGKILAQNTKRYFDEEQRQYDLKRPLKEHMTGWMLFEDDILNAADIGYCPKGEYMVVLLCKKDGRPEEMAARLHNIWQCMLMYEEYEEVYALLYQVKEQNVPLIYSGIEAEKIKCCVSEVFSEISLCRDKKNILKRMSQAEESREMSAVRREKEWAMWGMYTCTAPLFEKAELRDYSVERLLLEDEKNHTELYHTLRTYLFCENNVTVAAKRLHIHRNTMVYRLKQIKECIDADVNDYEVSRELLAFIMMNDIARQNIRSRMNYED